MDIHHTGCMERSGVVTAAYLVCPGRYVGSLPGLEGNWGLMASLYFRLSERSFVLGNEVDMGTERKVNALDT